MTDKINMEIIAEAIYAASQNGRFPQKYKDLSLGVKQKYKEMARAATFALIGEEGSDLKRYSIAASCRMHIIIDAHSRAEALAEANNELQFRGAEKVWALKIDDIEDYYDTGEPCEGNAYDCPNNEGYGCDCDNALEVAVTQLKEARKQMGIMTNQEIANAAKTLDEALAEIQAIAERKE